MHFSESERRALCRSNSYPSVWTLYLCLNEWTGFLNFMWKGITESCTVTPLCLKSDKNILFLKTFLHTTQTTEYLSKKRNVTHCMPNTLLLYVLQTLIYITSAFFLVIERTGIPFWHLFSTDFHSINPIQSFDVQGSSRDFVAYKSYDDICLKYNKLNLC
jgi:hypothetical protein